MRTIVLVAGPSGSGKSRLSAAGGIPHVSLDDFYRDGDEPGLPHTLGIVDWDDPASWHLDEAVDALARAATDDVVELPAYTIAANARTGVQTLSLGSARALVTEGVFAVDVLAPALRRGLVVVPIWLDRPRGLVALLRFVRDVRERRKPVGVLVRRGFALWRGEPALRRTAVRAGFEPLSMRAAQARVRDLA